MRREPHPPEEPASLEPETAGAVPPGAAGGEQRRLALGTAAIQGGRIAAIASVLVVATALGRTLTLAEFGVYGLTLSFAGYVLFIQGSVEAAAVRGIAAAADQRERDRAFTTAVVAYAGFGLLAGLLISAVGVGALGLLDIPETLRDEARAGVLAMAGLTFLGWPLRAYVNLLSGTQRFGLAAATEVAAYAAFVAIMLVLILATDAPLWAVIAGGGSLSVLTGLAAAVIVWSQRLPFRLRRRSLERGYSRTFAGFSGYVLAAAVTDVVIYSLDRLVLAAFKNAATVGLYEAVSRPQALVRQIQSALASTVFPASSHYYAEGEEARLRALLLRGTRYVVAATVPFVVVLMVLAGPILDVWLGPRYEEAATALTIFVSYWLLGAGMGVAGSMLFAAGRERAMTGYAWAVAAVNLILSVSLTALLGLEGVVLGTTLAYTILFPYVIHLAVETFGVSVGDFAREVWLPGYSVAAGVAATLVGVRLTVDVEGAVAVIGLAATGLALYWAAYWTVWLRPDERSLFRGLLARRG